MDVLSSSSRHFAEHSGIAVVRLLNNAEARIVCDLPCISYSSSKDRGSLAVSSLKTSSCIHSWYLCSDNNEYQIFLRLSNDFKFTHRDMFWPASRRNPCDEQKDIWNPSKQTLSPVWNQNDLFVDDRSELVGFHAVALRRLPDEGGAGLWMRGGVTEWAKTQAVT